MDNERFLFECFNRVLPNFADDAIQEWDVVEEWYDKRQLAPPAVPFDKRPDIICLTTRGKKIGLELKSWLEEQQIAEAKRSERIEDNLLRAIGRQPKNITTHIDYVWLSSKEVRFDLRDADNFRREIFALIEQVDQNWSGKDKWEQEHSEIVKDLDAFPSLAKYLNHVDFYPAVRSRRTIRWITFPCRGGAYDPREMRETLRGSLLTHRGDKRYEELAQRTGLDQVYLLVHYDFNAFAYNNPFGEPDFGFKEAAEFARDALAGDAGYFARIFLLNSLQGEEEAHRIS
jgi:hypothetical protein